MVAFCHLLLPFIVELIRGDIVKFERIEHLRIDNDKTQLEIANLLGCKRQVYRRYEKGDREIPIWAIIKLTQIYNCSVDYLLGLTDIKKPYPISKKQP